MSAAFYSQYEPKNVQGDKVTIQDKSKFIFENMSDGEQALIEVVDLAGNVVIDNTGSASLEKVTTPDYAKALTGETDHGMGTAGSMNSSYLSLRPSITKKRSSAFCAMFLRWKAPSRSFASSSCWRWVSASQYYPWRQRWGI